MQDVMGKKVFVGLSGGVDSAVSAALLRKAGADVTGVFIKGWYPPGMPCTWADDRRDTMRVAASLGIPFHTLDASDEYKRGVIDYLLSEYAAGRTPNPDVMCNREVKFGAFYEFAKSHDADYIATGHYCRTRSDLDTYQGPTSVQLLRGIDASKDQSYFLWAVPSEALGHTLFPVGELPKSEVRKLAEKFNLPVAEKKDSQGICFLGSISVEDFLRQELHTEEGVALDTKGNKIGTHDGAVLYTLGSRIALTSAGQGPWYVVAKDMRANTVTVSKEQFTEIPSEVISLRETNWFRDEDQGRTSQSRGTTLGGATSIPVDAQYRYHGPLIQGTYDFQKNEFTPNTPLNEPIASGQSLVLYSGDKCIGGGIII